MASTPEPPERIDAAPPAVPDWWLYKGDGVARVPDLPKPPPWRTFEATAARTLEGRVPPVPEAADVRRRLGQHATAVSYRRQVRQLNLVNAAIHLRRPMLVTGKAGTGKSTLARSIAAELGLGKVLHWPITSRSSLDYGLYQYDAIGRLQEVNLSRAAGRRSLWSRRDGDAPTDATGPDIGRYLRLGPLGSAMLARDRPRVLLIDEIDKSDIDLPNDLLTVFEDGFFEIRELVRMHSEDLIYVMDADSNTRVGIRDGRVECSQFPIIVMTSNGERDFPPAFLRRCIRIKIETPDRQRVSEIVEAHLGDVGLQRGREVIDRFAQRVANGEDLAADQLMNALHLTTTGVRGSDEDLSTLIDDLIRPLTEFD